MIDVSRARTLLQSVVGKPFTGVGRALDMGIISFGQDVEWIDPTTGSTRRGGEYAVHAQCPFRVVRQGRILVGSDDIGRSVATGHDGGASDAVQWTLFDRNADILDRLLAPEPPVVRSVDVTLTGDGHWELDGEMRIDVFRASATISESWRFFRRGLGEHLVIPED
jgi:hypothetical protein